MALLGSAGWWMPGWMERATPKISIEGDEWFAEHEAPSAPQANVPHDTPDEHLEHKSAD